MTNREPKLIRWKGAEIREKDLPPGVRYCWSAGDNDEYLKCGEGKCVILKSGGRPCADVDD
ncbi:MAG: hypothetical protein P1V36_17990, partial [Planctomycetota bacterium]|nr:hypothetical protein [Planctomycetota bacterium]